MNPPFKRREDNQIFLTSQPVRVLNTNNTFQMTDKIIRQFIIDGSL